MERPKIKIFKNQKKSNKQIDQKKSKSVYLPTSKPSESHVPMREKRERPSMPQYCHHPSCSMSENTAKNGTTKAHNPTSWGRKKGHAHQLFELARTCVGEKQVRRAKKKLNHILSLASNNRTNQSNGME